MKIHKTALPDVLILEPDIFRDERGFFMESFSERKLRSLGIDFRGVQDNHCLSEKKGTQELSDSGLSERPSSLKSTKGMHFRKKMID